MGIGQPDTPSHFLILGPSGSGITTALNAFGGFGFLTVGQVPLSQFETLFHSLSSVHRRTAFSLALTPQSAEQLDTFVETLKALKARLPELKVLVLDAPEAVLAQRYLNSTKTHPFEREGLQQAISLEKMLYQKLKPLKDYSINTGSLTPEEMQLKVAKILGISLENQQFTVYITSFGFKYGAPQDAELVFDMRFLKNPFYLEELRPLTGLDQPVKDYLFALPQTPAFLEKWIDLVGLMLPLYQAEGKTRLTVAIGCTGGQHRSVCMTEALAHSLRQAYSSYNIVVVHREMAGWPTSANLPATTGETR